EATIVSDVSAGHQVVAVADDRGGVGLHGPMDGGELADSVILSEVDLAGFFRAKNMLRHSAQDGAFANVILRPHASAIFNDGMGGNLTCVANDDIVFDNGKGTDAYIAADLGLRAHNRQRVDIHLRETSGM